MKAIGFRVETTAVHFAVVEGAAGEPVLVTADRYAAPKGYDEGDALTWYRVRTKTLIEEHRPDRAAIKYMESIGGGGRAPKSNDSTRRRHRIEGVILQLINEHKVGSLTGPFATVAARLGSRSAKSYIESDELRGLDWSGKTKLAKEAILVAVAALGEA